MKIETKLIFGIRTSGAVTLTLTADGPLPQQPPYVRIKTGEQVTDIFCTNNAWVATLQAGDHVVSMPAPGDSWFDATLQFTFSAPVTIVGYTDANIFAAWTAGSGITKDPKNPWPPPQDITSLNDAEWLINTLTTMRAQISTDRSAPAYLPARSH